MTQVFVALIMYIIHRYIPNPSYTVPDTGLVLSTIIPSYDTDIYLPNPSYTVPDTGLVLSTIIPSDDTGVCSPDNVYYTQIFT